MLLQILQGIVCGLSLFSYYYLTDVLITGRAIGRNREPPKVFDYYVSKHKNRVDKLLIITALTFGVVELFRIFLPQTHIHHSLLFRIHLYWFAYPFAGSLLLLRVWLTGRRFPRIHCVLVYPCIILLGYGTNILGDILAFQLS